MDAHILIFMFIAISLPNDLEPLAVYQKAKKSVSDAEIQDFKTELIQDTV